MATSPGSYKGVVIRPGTDAEIRAQIAAIDAGTSQTNAATNTRSLDFTAPTPTTYQAPAFNASAFSTAPTANDNYTKFNTALMGLLKTQQSMGTRGFQEAGFNAATAQNNAVLAPTSPGLVGAAPSTQDSVRSGQSNAYQPLVTGANNAAQTFGEQIRSLGDAIGAAKSFGDSYLSHQERMQEQARETITSAMKVGGAAGLEAIQKANPNIFKISGFDYDTLIAAARAQEKQQTQTDGPASVQEYEYAVAHGYKGSFTDYQNEDANRKRSIAAAGVGGLTPGQINTSVNSIASAFDNEPIVKAYNTAQEGFQTISSIGVNTKSPADDIAFIYAFAKIMDPNSVVREGEYNTVQRYAQTWADNFGFTAQRIFSNTNFLSADAKQKMLNALKPKVTTLTNQYTNLQSEYQRQIDDAYAGKPRQITNYAGSASTPPPTTGGTTGAPATDPYTQYLRSIGL